MRTLVACLLVLTVACGKPGKPKPQAAAVDLGLPADPGLALSVKEAKEKGPGEEVVAVGRVKDVVKGIAAFQLIDASLDYCGQKPGSMTDETPWDYCCETAEARAAATLTVEARGKDGQVLRGAMPSLRLLDLVAVRGTIAKDEHGNVTIAATGWYRRERPNLPEGLKWPE